MKKPTLIILAYAAVVLASVVSVKLAQIYLAHSKPIPQCMVADCGDPPPTPNPGE